MYHLYVINIFVSMHFYNFINKWFRFVDPLTYLQAETYPIYSEYAVL